MKNKSKESISVIAFLNKLLLCAIIFLLFAIATKNNPIYKEKLKDYLYNKNINFSNIRNIYSKYLGGVTSIKNNKEKQEVFNEKIKYTKITPYEEGAKLEVANNYLIPNQEEGIVIFIGKKDKYNNSIIIQTNKGINVLYGNICNSNLKLYDNVYKNNYIGESCDNYIYVKYEQEGKSLDYNNYLS